MKKIIGIIGGLALALFTFTVGSNTLTSSDITLSNLVNMDVAKAFDGEYDDDDVFRYEETVSVSNYEQRVWYDFNTRTGLRFKELFSLITTCEGIGNEVCEPYNKQWKPGEGMKFDLEFFNF